MKIIPPLAFTLATTLFVLISPAYAEEELAPPDVDFYLEAQINQADVSSYGFDTSDGLTVKAGMWLNSVKVGGNARLALEAGLLRQGKDTDFDQTERAPTGSEQDAGANTVRVYNDRSLEINGFVVGALWQSPKWIYLKGGGYIYDFKLKDKPQRVLLDGNGDTVISIDEAPITDSNSGIAPYFGAGLAIPLGGKLALTADFQVTSMESETYNTFAAGLRYGN